MRKPSTNFVFEEWNQRLQASYQLKYAFTEYIQESIASWETLKIAFMLFLFQQDLVTVFEEGIFVTSLLFELKTACFSVN